MSKNGKTGPHYTTNRSSLSDFYLRLRKLVCKFQVNFQVFKLQIFVISVANK